MLHTFLHSSHSPTLLCYYTSLFCLPGKCQGVIDISHWALYLCAMFQVLWSGFTLTFTSALFSLAFLGPLTENSSIGFQWSVFHLRQSSLPLLTRWLFDGGSLFWDPTFQHVVWCEIYCGCFVHWGLKNHPVPQLWQRKCAAAAAAVLGCSSR